MTKITYVGAERCDFVYHLSVILSLQGSVLVIDNSYSLDLIDAVSTDGTRDIREWRKITYAKDIDLKKTDVSDFDYVIVYAGLNSSENDTSEDNFTLIMPDFTKKALDACKDLPDMAKPIYLFRDLCSKKFTAKSTAVYLDVKRTDILGAIKLVPEDIAAYIALTHNHFCNVKSLSDEMQEALMAVIEIIFNVDERKAGKIIKAAKKVK